MNSNFRPDDSLFEVDDTGQMHGVTLVWAAQDKHGVRIGDGVITSRDPGMQEAKEELKREARLPGVEQWLIPIVICPTAEQVLVIHSQLGPNAKVPRHSHRLGHYRFVMQGSVSTESAAAGKVVLEQGDWMIVPENVEYWLEAGPEGCIMLYPHPGHACPKPA